MSPKYKLNDVVYKFIEYHPTLKYYSGSVNHQTYQVRGPYVVQANAVVESVGEAPFVYYDIKKKECLDNPFADQTGSCENYVLETDLYPESLLKSLYEEARLKDTLTRMEIIWGYSNKGRIVPMIDNFEELSQEIEQKIVELESEREKYHG